MFREGFLGTASSSTQRRGDWEWGLSGSLDSPEVAFFVPGCRSGSTHPVNSGEGNIVSSRTGVAIDSKQSIGFGRNAVALHTAPSGEFGQGSDFSEGQRQLVSVLHDTLARRPAGCGTRGGSKVKGCRIPSRRVSYPSENRETETP